MFNLFQGSAQGVGIEITEQRLQVAQIQKRKQDLKLAALVAAEVPEGYFQDGKVEDLEGVANLIGAILRDNKIKAKRAALAVPSHRTVTRLIKLPAELDDLELRENILNEQVPMLLPFTRDEADIDYQKLGFTRGDDDIQYVEVLLAATRRDVTDSFIEAAQKAGLTPDVLETSGFALLRTLREQLRQSFTPQEAVAIVDIGFDSTEISVVVDGVPHFTRDVPIGVQEMQSAVGRAMGIQIPRSPDWIKTMSLPAEVEGTALTDVTAPGGAQRGGAALLRVLRDLVDELRRSIDFYLDQAESQEVTQIYLAGPGSSLSQVDGFVSNRLGRPTSLVNPLSTLGLQLDQEIPAEDIPGLGVVLGLALREA